MQAVIGMRLYDTATGIKIGQNVRQPTATDPGLIQALYKGPNIANTYFLWSRGLPGTDFGTTTDKGIIQALTVDEAYQWAVDNLGKAKVDAEFGPLITLV